MRSGVAAAATVAAVLAITPWRVDAGICRRRCRTGEVRDVEGCCVRKRTPRRKLPMPLVGAIEVDCDVHPAGVSIDGRMLYENPPLRIGDLPPGKHKVVVHELVAGRYLEREVAVVAGQVTPLWVSFDGGKPPVPSAKEVAARALLERALAKKFGPRGPEGLAVAYRGHAADGQVGVRHLWEWPGRMVTVVDVPGADPHSTWLQVATPEGGFERVPWSLGDNLRKYTSDWARGQRIAHPDLVLLLHREVGTRVQPVEDDEPGRLLCEGCQVVRVTDKAGEAVTLYLDKALLPVRVQHKVSGVDTVDALSDYRRVGEGWFAFRWEVKPYIGEAAWSPLLMDAVELVPRIDAQLYQPPPADPPLRKRATEGSANIYLRSPLSVAQAAARLPAGCKLTARRAHGLTATCGKDEVIVRERGDRIYAGCADRSGDDCHALLEKIVAAAQAK